MFFRQAGQEGVLVDERLKQLMDELNAAVNNWLSRSQEVAQVMAKIEAGGYDVFLVLHATKKQEEEQVRQAPRAKGAVKSWLDPKDVRFLKSMHISADE